ncbi:MAG: S41 family peptidase [Planctomycetes bacterium]|nr:S41 family peptidase [Planctomycetota bacterium]
MNQKKLNGRCLDELMTALKRNYSHYDRTGTDWPARTKKLRKKIVAAKSTKGWVDAVARFLSAAEDPHIWINYKGKTTGTYQRKFTPNITLKGIEAEIGKLERRNNNALVTQIEGDIAYINIPSWSGGKKAEIEALQGILAETRGSKAMIIDVRGNSGGDESLARGVAAWFVEGEQVYAKHQFRDASAKGGFGPVMERKIVGNEGDQRFDGPVAVLMGPVNISSCESFLLMMKQGKKVTLVGAKSGGSSGNPKPFVLENDVEVYIPSWRDIQLDGSSLEGVGIEPDVVVTAKKEEYELGDPVIPAGHSDLK